MEKDPETDLRVFFWSVNGLTNSGNRVYWSNQFLIFLIGPTTLPCTRLDKRQDMAAAKPTIRSLADQTRATNAHDDQRTVSP
jgi:hypothetical protein